MRSLAFKINPLLTGRHFFLIAVTILSIASCRNPGKGLIIIEPTSAIGQKKATMPFFECFIDSFDWHPSMLVDSLPIASSVLSKGAENKKILRIDSENRHEEDSTGIVQIISIRIDDFKGAGHYDTQVLVSMQSTEKSTTGPQSISYVSKKNDAVVNILNYDTIGMKVSGDFDCILHQIVPLKDSVTLHLQSGKFDNLSVIQLEPKTKEELLHNDETGGLQN